MQEQVVYKTLEAIWQRDIEVRKEHLSGLLSLLVGNKRFRENTWYVKPFDTLMKLIDSAIKQGAYLSTGDCAALAEMATDIRSGHRTYRKADTKKMIARAEPVETLAGAAPANIPDV